MKTNLKMVTKSKDIVSSVEHAKKLDQKIKALTVEFKAEKEKIQKHLGEKEELIFSDREIATWKHHSKEVFNTADFKEKHAELYASFLETVEYRRFLLK